MSDALDDVEFLSRSANRVAVLDALAGRRLSRHELEAEVDASRVTVGRILSDAIDRGWVTRSGQEYDLTPVGTTVNREFSRFIDLMTAVHRLDPLDTSLPVHEFDPEWFVDATVTTVGPNDPYGPLNRFESLLAETETLRGFDTTTVSPTHAEDLHERIRDGMPVEMVYEPAVLELLTTEYAALTAEAFACENLTVRVHDALPFGMAIFDDHVCFGDYDDATGLLQALVDTSDPGAIAWAEDRFEQYREEARRL